jgi:hypothetical protein
MRRWIALFAISVAVCVPVLGADRGIAVKQPAEAGLGEYEPERCHALIIGISQYKSWPALRCAASDAKELAKVLRTSYGMKNTRLLLDEQATRRGIFEAIDSYTKLTDRDCLFIYYAGHGEMDENRNGFWVPSDAPRNDKFSYIPNSQIVNDYFKKFKVKHLLVAADSCFSGTMLRGGPEQKREEGWELPSGFRKPSRWILTSGDLAPVPDDAGTGHSPFATRVLQFLKYSDAPAFGVQDLYVYVRRNLKSSAICQPLDTDGHMPGGEYVFCRLGDASAVPVPPQPPITGPAVTPQPKTTVAPPVQPVPVPVKKPVEQQVAPTPPPTPPPVQPPARVGTLVVTSAENATGTLDGARPFTVPAGGSFWFADLPAGRYTLRMTADGKTFERVVSVGVGRRVEVKAVFAKPETTGSVRPKVH